MPPKISNERLETLLASEGQSNPLYTESVKLYNDLKVHADGIFPDKLIKKRRPSESEEIFEYRKDTYEPITKLPISQVVNCYGKIRRSSDWMINFPVVKNTGRIPENETLEKYCNENLPGFVSITNWAFDILLPQNLLDANAVVAVIPTSGIMANVFVQPAPIIFNSDQVLYFNEREKICLLKSRIRTINNVAITSATGDLFYYLDDTVIILYQKEIKGYSVVFEVPNITGQLPAFRIKSESFKQYDSVSLNRSRLHAMVPFLNKAATGDSDLDGSKVQHLFPLFWYYQSKECAICKGTGRVTSPDGPVTCSKCDGGGKVKFSPYAHIQVDPSGFADKASPIPPAGYVVRDTEILKLQEASVEKNNYKALCAMNMQFLDQTPLSISGDAKQVDREELNNTVYTTAEDLVYSVDKAICLINDWRYGYLVPDKNTRRSMLPQIPVPQNFDLLPEDYLMKEVTDARNAKVNPLLIATLEYQLAAKKFYNHPELAANIKLYFDLDPLPGVSVDEKMSLISNKAITQQDFVISSYIASFIKRAIREVPDFDKMEYVKQMEILNGYADEKITANDTSAQMIADEKQKVLDELKNQGIPPAPAPDHNAKPVLN